MIKRIYIDTSVFGGYFDKEFAKETKPFFEKLLQNRIKIVVSEILELELYRAPDYIQVFFESLPSELIKRIRGYNSINFREGYQMIEIRTPKEIFSYENE